MFAITDFVPAIFQNHGIRVRGGIGFSVNKPEEKGIPILKFGKANNFYKFRAALSNEATERYGNLGKLIDLEKYYVPTFVVEDYTAMGFSDEQGERMNLEKFKEHSRKLTKMEDDRPKLYGLRMPNGIV